jgi:glycerol-3-phosphate dehydrogenase
MVPKTDDHRVLFAIPWHERVLIGTTETTVSKPQLEPRPLREEIEFLLTHAARYLTKDPKPRDVLSAFAGLRPLVKFGKTRNTALVPRDHTILVSAAGLVTITGGKWTTYRQMAEDTVDRAAEVAGLEKRACTTAALRLHGAEGGGRRAEGGEAMFSMYGSDGPAVMALLETHPAWNERLHPDLPYRAADVIWAVRHEMARTVEDVLSRRTRLLLLDARASIELAPKVARWMAQELGRDEKWERQQVAGYRALAEGYLVK